MIDNLISRFETSGSDEAVQNDVVIALNDIGIKARDVEAAIKRVIHKR